MCTVITRTLRARGRGFPEAGKGEHSREMGRVFTVELEGRIYRCCVCRTHLALAEDVVSKAFHSRRGKAYLFNNVSNISTGDQEERMMQSGMHVVADIFCCFCGQNVGWKYWAWFPSTKGEAAYYEEVACEKSQKYKEGKYVLERAKIVDGVDTEFYIDTHPSGSDVDEN